MRVACRLSLLCVPHLAVSDCQLQQIWLSPPRSSSPCRHLSNTFDSVAAAGAYLSWLPGGISISVQPQFSHTLSLVSSTLLCLPFYMAFGCSFACENVASFSQKLLFGRPGNDVDTRCLAHYPLWIFHNCSGNWNFDLFFSCCRFSKREG